MQIENKTQQTCRMLDSTEVFKLIELSTCIGPDGFQERNGEELIVLSVAVDKLTDALAWLVTEHKNPNEMYSEVGQKLFNKIKIYSETENSTRH